MAIALFGRNRDTAKDQQIRELRLELSAEKARIAAPVAFNSESFVGFGDSSNAKAVFSALRGTAASADRAIRNRIQSLRLGVYVRRFVNGDFEDTPAFNHPLQLLLDRPTLAAGGMITHSGRQLWGVAVTQYNSVGECYLLVIKDGMGVPMNLQLAQPGSIEPLVSDGQLTGYRLITGSTSVNLRPEDVVRIWDPDPFDIYTSQGSMVRNASAINRDSFVNQHVERFYQNDATPKMVLESQNSLAEIPQGDDHDNFMSQWVKRLNRRFGNRQGAPQFIHQDWKVHELSSQNEAAGVATMLKQSGSDVLEGYGVSPSIIGVIVDVNRAAAETARFGFDQQTVEPISATIADALTTQLAGQYEQPTDEIRLIVKYLPFIARDKDFDLREDDMDLRNFTRTINEVRAGREPSLPPVDYGDLPVGTIGQVPYDGEISDIDLSGFELAVPDEELPPEIDDESEETETPEEEERSRNAGYVYPPRELPIMRRLRAHFTPELEWARQLQRDARFTPQFQSRQRQLIAKQAEITLKRLRKVDLRMWNTDQGSRIDDWSRAHDDELDAMVEELFPIEGWQKLFEQTTNPVRATAFLESASAATLAITGKAFNLTEAAREAVTVQNLSHYVFTNRTTQDGLREALRAGLAEGESIDQIAARVAHVFTVRRSDATRIARTEIAAAVSEAQVEGYKQTGVVERKQWNSSLDAVVRDSHLIDGQVRDLDEDFTLLNGSRAHANADPKLPPADRINCRCFVTPVFFDEDAAGLGFPIGAQGELT